MTTKHNMLFDGSFNISVAEYRALLPEGVADDVIKLLSLNPHKIVEDGHNETIKDQITDRLVFLLSRFGGPSPSQMGTTPKQLQKHATKLEKQLRRTIAMLRSMEYEAVFGLDDRKTDFVVAHNLRLQSLPQDKPKIFYSEDAAKHEYERTGEWLKLYPFDSELPQAIAALERVASHFDPVIVELTDAVKGRGKHNEGKDRFNTLIRGLCDLYRDYTGEDPKSVQKADGSATGRIIGLLRIILPHTYYKREITDLALHQKVGRLEKARVKALQ